MPATATCSSCGASIIWTVTEAGKSSPVDAIPVAGGNLRLTEQPYPLPPLTRVVGAGIDLFDDTDDGTRHLNHFATCPNAAEHRKPR